MAAQMPADEGKSEPCVDNRMGGWVGLSYADVEVGKQFPSCRIRHTAANIQRFAAVTGWSNSPRFVPAFLLNELRSLKSFIQLPPGVLHAREELVLNSAAMPDEELEVEVGFADKFIRNDKRFVVVRQRVRSASDYRLILEIVRTLYWPC